MIIVGYSNSELRSGVSLATAQFTSLNGEGFSLDMLVPKGDDVQDNVYIDTFDEFGAPVDTYYWVDLGDGPTWTADFETPATGVTFGPGQAFSVTASDPSQTLQSAGQVPTDDVVFQLRSGVSLCGNPFPLTISLMAIVPSGEEVQDNVYIDTFDEFGAPVDTYYWVDLGDGPTWTADFESPAEGVTFPAGQGLSITASSEDQYVTFTAPEI